jgi:Transposase IS116/IS110/IS902 family
MRASSIKKAVSYCGLCGDEQSSADRVQRTPLSKRCNKHLQTTLIQAAKMAPRYSSVSRAAVRQRKAERQCQSQMLMPCGARYCAASALIQGGTPRQVTFDRRIIQGVSWDADGSALIYSSSRGGLPSLWRIPASGGTPEPLPFGSGGRAIRPVVARKGNRMTYTNMAYSSSIWRAELPIAGAKPAPPAKFIVSTELEEGVRARRPAHRLPVNTHREL